MACEDENMFDIPFYIDCDVCIKFYKIELIDGKDTLIKLKQALKVGEKFHFKTKKHANAFLYINEEALSFFRYEITVGQDLTYDLFIKGIIK